MVLYLNFALKKSVIPVFQMKKRNIFGGFWNRFKVKMVDFNQNGD